MKLEKDEKKLFHILIDMDEVTVDLHTDWFTWVNKEFKDDLTNDRVRSWQVHEYTKAGHACYEFFKIPGVFLTLKPKPNAVKVINKLRNAGHRIQFCTQPPRNSETAVDEKKEWLRHHFEWFNEVEDVIFTQDKSSVKGDILFDDRYKWLLEFPKISVAMAAPYNEKWAGFKVDNWKDFESLIERLSKHT